MCWGRGPCPFSKCSNTLVSTDGYRVTFEKDKRYRMNGIIPRGDLSLTIQNAALSDTGIYCCRIEFKEWFNDYKENIFLEVKPDNRNPAYQTTGSKYDHLIIELFLPNRLISWGLASSACGGFPGQGQAVQDLRARCAWRSAPAAAQTVVTGYVGQTVTLPCTYASWSQGSHSMCWGKGSCPKSKCNEELLHTDDRRVVSRKSSKYQLWGNIRRGDVSLTISNTNEGDSAVYCCRIEVPGWFNDVKKNIVLRLTRAPTTTRRPTTRRPTTRRPTTTTTTTTTTAMPTTTTVLPTTVMTTPDLTTRTPVQTRTTTALTTMTTTCPWTTPSSLPEATTILLTTVPSTEGSTLTAAPETTSLVENEVEPEQLKEVDSSFLAKIIAPSLGFVLVALIVALLLRVQDPSGAGDDLAIRGRRHPIKPLLLPLLAAQASASPGYLSLEQPSATEQLLSEDCLHLRLALGSWGAERTGHCHLVAVGTTIFEGGAVN
ncbi:T-cell immunoglobulin and mucin domain-containing protein 4 [Myotis davidii]|nr:T-cell immunoglobulin and mucin domain-containing protein 4 [Myotis davidii]